MSQDDKDGKPIADKLPAKWGLSEARFYSACENEPVKIHLRSGDTLNGFIIGVDNYGIGLEVTGRANPVWVHKHAIDYIERE